MSLRCEFSEILSSCFLVKPGRPFCCPSGTCTSCFLFQMPTAQPFTTGPLVSPSHTNPFAVGSSPLSPSPTPHCCPPHLLPFFRSSWTLTLLMPGRLSVAGVILHPILYDPWQVPILLHAMLYLPASRPPPLQVGFCGFPELQAAFLTQQKSLFFFFACLFKKRKKGQSGS